MFQPASAPWAPAASSRGLDPDRPLVDAWVARADAAAFERLVERHQEHVFRVALSVLGPAFAADAEDVAQEVFIRAAVHLREFRGESLVRTWLHRLALNLARDRRRRPRWRQPHVDPAVLDRQPATGRGDDPYVSVADAERSRLLMQSLDALPDELRSVIHLHYWLDLHVEDIAVTLEIPIGTVKSHLHRARGLLARLMRSNRTSPGRRAQPVGPGGRPQAAGTGPGAGRTRRRLEGVPCAARA